MHLKRCLAISFCVLRSLSAQTPPIEHHAAPHHKQITLPSGVIVVDRLAGFIFTLAGHRPLSNAAVALCDEQWQCEKPLLADAHGVFNFQRDPQDGLTYRLSVTANGYTTRHLTVQIAKFSGLLDLDLEQSHQ
jgi:hypothetical protein